MGTESELLRLTSEPLAFVALGVFVLAYIGVVIEEFSHLRKSKPVILGAGIIWVLIAVLAANHGVEGERVEEAVKGTLEEYAELLMFLLVAMTYINAITERGVFDVLRARLVSRGLSYRKLFWLTGLAAFFLSPVADNLTTALILGSVVMAVGADNHKFVGLSFINIVVAANAGGAFSPFGDITTLMVWQAGKLPIMDFLMLFGPSAVNFLVPALLMTPAVPSGQPASYEDTTELKPGARRIVALFLLTIATAVGFEHFLHLPPFLGMMTGLAYLMFFSYYLKQRARRNGLPQFDIFNKVAQAEWDTLLFFFGVMFCVGGLAYIGYLEIASQYFYGEWGATNANITAGLASSIIDNIPIMFAVLRMDPAMGPFQWLLIALTAGVGGSLLSVGSAAGVALMAQSKGRYTFFQHLAWTWAVAAGYAASIVVHFLINSGLRQVAGG